MKSIDNCLSLQSAQKILEYVRQNDGLLTWYNIVKRTDQLQVEKIPPPYYVIQQLLKEGYLAQDTDKNENSSKYLITERARQYLGEQVKVRQQTVEDFGATEVFSRSQAEPGNASPDTQQTAAAG